MSEASDNLEATLDLFDAGVEMMREHLRRELPGATSEEIERRLEAWLAERPGAEHGDGVGRPRRWPSR